MWSSLFFALAVTAAGDGAPGKAVETSLQSTADLFEGSQYRQALGEATLASNQRNPILAWEKLRPALQFCDAKQNDATTLYLSVSAKDEAESFIKSHSNQHVVLIDMVCPGAYKMAAFLFVNSNQYDSALSMLDKAQALAPFWAEALGERGYILRGRGDLNGALDAYRKALDLAQKYPRSAYMQGVALRGIGYALTD